MEPGLTFLPSSGGRSEVKMYSRRFDEQECVTKAETNFKMSAVDLHGFESARNTPSTITSVARFCPGKQ